MKLHNLIIVAALACGAAGCTCPGPSELFAEYFEYCADPTCEWQVSGEGRADLVTTIHPGEHGLLLADSVQVRSAAPVSINYGSSYNSGEYTVELVTNCDEVYLTLEDGELGTRALVIILAPGPERPPRGGYQLHVEPMPRPGSTMGDYLELDSITVVNQQGFCVIDELRIMTPTPVCYG
jgi:hypothetical protein